ncbi:hypothetical protein [Brucella sp. IR073]|uniref:hypothetical protein n=1 Tax=unclassified Brucella TaxID=2632610 RepID=UPI003B984B45
MPDDPETDKSILPCKPDSWEGLFQLYGKDQVPGDFLNAADRRQPPQDRDPFEGWKE